MKCNLATILAEEGRKQKWLCEKVGLSTSAMSQIVRGESIPTLQTAMKIARALNRKIEEVWEDEESA